MAKQPADWYDDNADGIADHTAGLPIREHYEWPALESLLPALDGKRVLDAGCGDGLYTAKIAERGADALGIDASEDRLEIAERKRGEDAEFRQADLREPLSFIDDESVDVVVSQLALDHLEDWDPAFAAFHRVLRPGGQVVCSVNHPVFLWGKLKRAPPGEFGLDAPTYVETERWSGDLLGRGGDDRDDVTFYRRPLAAQVNAALDAGFALDGLVEPTPTDEFRAAKPEAYEKRLRQPPTFICYRFRKADSTEETDSADGN